MHSNYSTQSKVNDTIISGLPGLKREIDKSKMKHKVSKMGANLINSHNQESKTSHSNSFNRLATIQSNFNKN